MKAKLIKVGKYMAARLKERSTYTGFALLLTASGIAFDPDKIALITSIGIGFASLLNIFLSDENPLGETPASSE